MLRNRSCRKARELTCRKQIETSGRVARHREGLEPATWKNWDLDEPREVRDRERSIFGEPKPF